MAKTPEKCDMGIIIEAGCPRTFHEKIIGQIFDKI